MFKLHRRWLGLIPLMMSLVGLVVATGCRPSTGARQGDKKPIEPLEAGAVMPPLEPASWINVPEGFDAKRLAGKVVVVEAFATWCADCRVATPGLVRLHQTVAADDVVFVALTSEPGADMEKFLEFAADYKLPWPIGFGAIETLAAFGVQQWPTTFVVGRDGRIVWSSVSYGANLPQELEAAIHRARTTGKQDEG